MKWKKLFECYLIFFFIMNYNYYGGEYVNLKGFMEFLGSL